MEIIRRTKRGDQVMKVNEQFVKDHRLWMKEQGFEVLHRQPLPTTFITPAVIANASTDMDDAGEYAPVHVQVPKKVKKLREPKKQ